MSRDRLLDAIYSAAFDIDGWQAVCDQVSEHANAVGSVLICSRPELRPFNMCRSDSIGEMMDDYVRDGWNLRDARSMRVQTQGLSGSFFSQGYVLDSQLVSPQEMEREPFYADLLYPHGLKWMCGLRIGDTSNWVALVINRGFNQDDFEPNEVQSLLRYGRHLNRAARVAEIADFTKLDAALQTFEATATPAFAIDATGMVRKHNQAADSILGTGLALKSNRLVCDVGHDQIKLNQLISQLAAVDSLADPADPVVIRRRNGMAAYVVRGCPLKGPPVDIFAGPTAILFATALRPSRKQVAALLQQSFGLSIKQAQVTELLAQGYSLRETADQMGIAPSTASDHLKAVFLRTGTHRQAELVALVSRLMH